MNIKIQILRLFFVVLVVHRAIGQDIHFSQIDINPILLNPAYSGFFDGKGRFGVVYRNQWASVSDPYQTFGLTGEWNLYRSKYYGDGFNVGITFTRDESGSLDYGITQGNIILSYFKGLNRKNNNFISLGICGGFGQRSFNLDNAIFPDQDEVFQNINSTYFDLSIGIAWFYNPVNNWVWKLGFGAKHVNKPNISHMQLDDIYLAPNYNAYVRMEYRFSDLFSILPVLVCQFQDKYTEFLYGTDFKWYAYEEPGREINFSAGIYFRQSDAIVFGLNAEYNAFLLGLSYDTNISSLTPATHSIGGFELALVYRIKNRKNIRNKVIPCATFL